MSEVSYYAKPTEFFILAMWLFAVSFWIKHSVHEQVSVIKKDLEKISCCCKMTNCVNNFLLFYLLSPKGCVFYGVHVWRVDQWLFLCLVDPWCSSCSYRWRQAWLEAWSDKQSTMRRGRPWNASKRRSSLNLLNKCVSQFHQSVSQSFSV